MASLYRLLREGRAPRGAPRVLSLYFFRQMSRRVNRGGGAQSESLSSSPAEGGPRGREGGRDAAAPRDASRRTVLVMGPGVRRGGPHAAPGAHASFSARPHGASPLLMPRQGPPMGSPLQQETPADAAEGPPGGPSGERRKLPLMALSDIIRQQHAKGKVSRI